MDATWGKGETGPSSSSGGGGQGPVSTQPTSSASGATGRITVVKIQGVPRSSQFFGKPKTSGFLINARFASVVLDSVLGPLRLAQHN